MTKLKRKVPTKATTVAKPTKTPTAKAAKAAKPTTPKYTFASGYDGASDIVNARKSSTPVDYDAFGSKVDMPLTDRDTKAIAALRAEFGGKPFERANLDTGILKRLGERGFIAHVSGSPVEPDAMVKLTSRKVA